MLPRDRASLQDILDAAELIGTILGGREFEDFAGDRRSQLAIERLIITMGEAAKRVSPDFRAQHPEIPWRDIAGMRDILVHRYDSVAPHRVWKVASLDVPELAMRIAGLCEPG